MLDVIQTLNFSKQLILRSADRVKLEDNKVVSSLTRDVKIEADHKLHHFIKEEIQKYSPLSILSEEDVLHLDLTNFQDYFWILDPIDGSVNFSRNIPLSCISLALWKGTEAVLGVVYDFNRNELFSGVVGMGAWLNDHSVQVSKISSRQESIMCTGFPVASDFSQAQIADFVSSIQSYKKVRLLGSAALSLSYLAAGRVEAYRENNIALWDVAAGIALVKAAGGRVEYQPTAQSYRFNVGAYNI